MLYTRWRHRQGNAVCHSDGSLKVPCFHPVAFAVVYVVNTAVRSVVLRQHVTVETTLHRNELSVTCQRSYFYAAAQLLARLEGPTSCCTFKFLLEECSVVIVGVRQHKCQHSLELVTLSCS